MDAHNIKNGLKRAVVVMALLCIAFIISMKSNYNIFLRGGNQTSDGDVFRCIGWLMTKGYVPYKDIFDHKGPFLYFLQYIATFLGKVRGIWPIEVLFMTGSVFIGYLFSRRFNSRCVSIFIVLLTFARWYECGYGNCTEEFSVLFQLISIYYFVDFFLSPEKWINEICTSEDPKCIDNQRNTRIRNRWFDVRVCLIGICFACTFFMKANLCAVWIVFCISIFINCIKNKYGQSLGKFVISFLIGVAVVALPTVLYLAKEGAIEDFIYDYFTFNSMYSSDISRVNIKTRVNAFFTFTNIAAYILAFCIMALKIRKKEKTLVLDVTYTIFMLASVLLVTISGQTYTKMEITFIPFLIYPFSILPGMLGYQKDGNQKLAWVVAGYLIITLIYPAWSGQIVDAAKDINRYVNDPDNLGMNDDEIVMYIENNTTTEDKISVFGNRCVYYLYTDREPASKYIFLPDPSVDNTIVEEYFEDLRESLPRIIVIASNYTGKNKWVAEEMDAFLEEYGYTLVIDGSYPVYQHN